MATSIRERILKQAKVFAEAITGIGTVYRWDARGQNTFANLDCIIDPVDESSDDGAIGNPGTIRNKLTLLVSVVLLPDESGSSKTDELLSLWAGNLKDKFLNNRTFVEAVTAKRLAVDSFVHAIDGPEYVDGAAAATIRIDVIYDHDGDSIYALGTAIPAA